ncbi:MAG TPA: mechanosensitive ion channel domain-containing protein [Candidatus Dormibacteraeota bacterium]|nr:mechanosensitive ion channel domain-containing protein [Candidatus Dormibacteraeota bacterium]
MSSAASAIRGVFSSLASPQLLWQLPVILIALGVAWMVERTAQAPPAGAANGQMSRVDRLIGILVMLAPLLAGLLILLIGHGILAALGHDVRLVDMAVQLAAAIVVLRLAVHALGRLLGPESWVGSRERSITVIFALVVAVALLGWLDAIEAALNRVNLVPGRSQFSLWALLKGLVVVTAFVVVASLIARGIERQLMRLEQLAVSTRVGISKFTYFLLIGLGILLGINTTGVDVTTLNVLTGAIGLGLGFGLQSVASNFLSGFVLLMDKSIKPGDVISFTAHTGGDTSTSNFGWVQELRGRYVVVRDRDGVDTLVPNQNLINSPFINWSYSDQRVRIRLPVTVSYEDDPEVALQLLLEAAANHPRILHDPAPVSRLISFEENGMRLEIRFWIADPVNGVNNVRSDVNRAIWRIFRTHGVTIPYPQRDVRMREPRRPLGAAPLAPPPPGRDQAAD